MAFKKITSIALVVTIALMMAACSKEEVAETTLETTIETETTTVACETTTEATEATVEETIPEETVEETTVETVNGIKYNVDASTEFAEPVLYEVTTEVVAYSDWQANSIALTYPVGSWITAISTDGYYVMQDNGYIIEISALQLVED